MLEHMAEDAADGGIVAELTESRWRDSDRKRLVRDAVSLRVLGALHAFALSGEHPELAAAYPPRADADAAWETGRALLRTHREAVEDFLSHPPQTNEVGRSAVLFGGFLRIARDTGLPLDLFEIGASGGLNLLWDRFRYETRDWAWGPADSPVVLRPEWDGPPPPLDAPLTVAGRAACDAAPLDLKDAAARRRLEAYVWAEQTERLERLRAAVALARAEGIHVEQADAAEWAGRMLTRPAPGRTRVLYHSVFWQYPPEATREAIRAVIAQAAGQAEAGGSPFAWLHFEPARRDIVQELRLTLWPGGEERLLARAHSHGGRVEWLE